jgi:hypothetical protein
MIGDARTYRGALVLPLRDADGNLHSLQFIGADGSKRFLSGGRVTGCFSSVTDTDGPIVIAEVCHSRQHRRSTDLRPWSRELRQQKPSPSVARQVAGERSSWPPTTTSGQTATPV